ncbi:MAG: hypothetical protein O7G87_16505 [bacterium]|nr:hypothetical protein [bacterium]
MHIFSFLLLMVALPPWGQIRAQKSEQPRFTIHSQNKDRVLHGTISVPTSRDTLWSVLVDYDRLSNFMPHLEHSRRLNSGNPILLEQVSMQKFLFFKKRTRIVLQVTEHPPDSISFSLQEGDFKIYRGAWVLQDEKPVLLQLNLCVRPDFYVPRFVLNHIVKNSGTQSLISVRAEAIRRQASNP